MKVGDLVKTTRFRIGCPADSLGLVVGTYSIVETTILYPAHDRYSVCRVFMFSKQRIMRIFPRDLEVLEATIS